MTYQFIRLNRTGDIFAVKKNKQGVIVLSSYAMSENDSFSDYTGWKKPSLCTMNTENVEWLMNQSTHVIHTEN